MNLRDREQTTNRLHGNGTGKLGGGINQIFTLTEMVDQNYDIADPVQQSLEVFIKTANEMDRIIDLGFEKIIQMSKVY